jgi:23S rRNA (uracil1939-C5)-methyltransferase
MVETPVDATMTCRHFGRCGGCSALDVPMAQQLEAKLVRLRDAVAPWLGDVVPLCPVPPRLPRHDRTQVLYPVQQDPEQGLSMGIYQRGSHVVEEITECRIQHRTLTALAADAQTLFRKMGLAAYDEGNGRGLLRAFHARVAPGTNELLLGLVTTGLKFNSADEVTHALRELAGGRRDEQGRPVQLVGIVRNVNDKPGNALLGAFTKALWGRPWLTDRAGGLTFRVSFGSFYQHHRHAEAILYRPALAMLGDLRSLTVVDGYGGVGTFGLRLAVAGSPRVTIVESSAVACADARANAEENQLSGITVLEAPFATADFERPDVLVVDPPRAGLQQPGAERVLAAGAARVLLASCALPSLARDLELLAKDYRVTAMQLCDLFPHTEHIEVLTLLQRRG